MSNDYKETSQMNDYLVFYSTATGKVRRCVVPARTKMQAVNAFNDSHPDSYQWHRVKYLGVTGA